MWELDFAGLQYELERYGYFPISDKDIDKLDKAKEIIRRYLDGANGEV